MQTFEQTGIPVIASWDIIDSTKIKKAMGCLRDYFITHIVGLKQTTPNEHLVFGGAMADAHEAIRKYMDNSIPAYGPMSVSMGKAAFQQYYLKHIPNSIAELEDPLYIDDPNNLKSLTRGLLTIDEYCHHYRDDEFRLVGTECLSRIPIGDNNYIWAKTDAAVENRNGFWIVEDKTSGYLNPYTIKPKRANWIDQWDRDFQIGAYDFALWVFASAQGIDPNRVKGVIVNGILLYSRRTEFIRLPQYRTPEQRQQWLFEARYWNATLKANMEMLASCTPEQPAMNAFPRNPSKCGLYGCNHPGLCDIPNPLRKCEQWFDRKEYPIDYKIEHWDPTQEFKALPTLEEVDENGE